MSRWKAASIHFSLSLLAFLLLLAVILLIWYPGILFSVDGGWTGLRIVIGVDLVLGPLLTLVVFKAGKPGLKFDLAFIGIAQVLCMSVGIWIIYQERPLALVLAYDTIYSIAEQNFEEFDRDVAVLEEFPGRFPKLIYVELPENEIAADIASLRSQFIGDPLYIQTEKYRALPPGAEGLSSIFRREDSVRASVSEEMLSQLESNCVLSKFLSAVISGYVCYDPQEMALSRFYDNRYLRDEPEPAEGAAQ